MGPTSGRRGPDPADRLPWEPLEGWRIPLGMAWLASRLGVSRETLSRWRSAGVPADRADDIARALTGRASTTRAWLWKDGQP